MSPNNKETTEEDLTTLSVEDIEAEFIEFHNREEEQKGEDWASWFR